MSDSWPPPQVPYINSENHQITSPPTRRYNCIAWAAGFDTDWWWPEKEYFWPQGVPREVTLSAFLAAFETLGYDECQDSALEEGYEKVALFARSDGKGDLVPTHAAKQLSNGYWTSKLGSLDDIEHIKLEDINGPAYGAPVRFMRCVKS